MRKCLFCDSNADSKEHLWHQWILEKFDEVPIRLTISDLPTRILPTPERKFKGVCDSCNRGWMGTLESKNRFLLGAMMHDISTPLDQNQQNSIAVWAVKTTMAFDASVRRKRNPFYTRNQCEEFRLRAVIPDLTNVWVGHFSMFSIAHFAADVSITINKIPEAGYGCVATLVLGHLVFQVMTVHISHSEYKAYGTIPVRPKDGPWDRLLTPIWPITRSVSWPPPLSFTNDGGLQTIGRLLDRWRIDTHK